MKLSIKGGNGSMKKKLAMLFMGLAALCHL